VWVGFIANRSTAFFLRQKEKMMLAGYKVSPLEDVPARTINLFKKSS
jgi:hypothetical protein